jgi:hypothetical protein
MKENADTICTHVIAMFLSTFYKEDFINDSYAKAKPNFFLKNEKQDKNTLYMPPNLAVC